ncbi:MAG: FkbM family methyltransferase [Ferruginibacter sp.]
MKHFFKKLAYKSLGQSNYLKLLSHGYKFLYNTGLLKNNPSYQYHYFSKNLIHEGDTVLDIGANVGYYSMLFAKWIGPEGKLIAVEPVPDFFKMLQWNTKQFSNITYYNYALGLEEKEIHLVVPNPNGYLRTGLANVQDENNPSQNEGDVFTFSAMMKKASDLFAAIPVINFIKIDIEGYEEFVLPEMKPVLVKHKPVLQVETWGSHKKPVEDFLHGIGYLQYELHQGKLAPVTDFSAAPAGDYIFIHPENNQVIGKLSAKGLIF